MRLLGSSDATAYYWPAPGRTDGIPERDQRHGYKSVFTNSWLVRQRNRSWVKGLGKNLQEWTRSLLAVPFVRGYRTVTPRTPRNNCVYTSQAPRWHGMRGVLTRLPAKTHKNRNARLDALRSAVPKQITCLYSLRGELVKSIEDTIILFFLNKISEIQRVILTSGDVPHAKWILSSHFLRRAQAFLSGKTSLTFVV